MVKLSGYYTAESKSNIAGHRKQWYNKLNKIGYSKSVNIIFFVTCRFTFSPIIGGYFDA